MKQTTTLVKDISESSVDEYKPQCKKRDDYLNMIKKNNGNPHN